MITAKVIAASADSYGNNVTTMELVYPRFIHAEFMTHREFNRNASSSRAIPTARFIEQVRNEPVLPSKWGRNQKGMQAYELLNEDEAANACLIWEAAASSAALYADELRREQVHKQIVNRVLEPYTHIRVVATSSSWSNFLGLRDHHAAQPEIQILAQDMRKAMEEVKVRNVLLPGEWHLPYIKAVDHVAAYNFCKQGRITRDEPRKEEINGVLLKVSAARCARASYNNFEGKPSTIEEDIRLFADLVDSKPVHASPTEHQCTPMQRSPYVNNTNPATWEQGVSHMDREGNLFSGSLKGFIQFRKLIPGEYIK